MCMTIKKNYRRKPKLHYLPNSKTKFWAWKIVQIDFDGIYKHIQSAIYFHCWKIGINSLDRIDIETVLNHFDGLVVVDEAYINFSKQKSFVQELTEYPNQIGRASCRERV